MSRKNPRRFLVLLILLLCAPLIALEAFAHDSGAYPALSGDYRSSGQHPRALARDG
jgi:hypothetical protein